MQQKKTAGKIRYITAVPALAAAMQQLIESRKVLEATSCQGRRAGSFFMIRSAVMPDQAAAGG
jgi:hypothetical protein